MFLTEAAEYASFDECHGRQDLPEHLRDDYDEEEGDYEGDEDEDRSDNLDEKHIFTHQSS